MKRINIILLGLMLIFGIVFFGCKTTEQTTKALQEVTDKQVSNIDRATEEEVEEVKTLQSKSIKIDDSIAEGYGYLAEVTGDRVRIRRCPEVSTNCQTLGYVNTGDVVQVLDKGGVPYEGKLWYKVKLADDTVGWMYEEYARKSDNKVMIKKVLDRPLKQEEITGFKKLTSDGILLVFYDTTNMGKLVPKAKANIAKTNLIFYDEEGKIKKELSLRSKQTWEEKVYYTSSKVVLSKQNNYIMFGYDKVQVYGITGEYIGSVDTSAYVDDIEVDASILSDNPEGIFVPASYDYLYIMNASKEKIFQTDIRGIKAEGQPLGSFAGYYVSSDISDDGEYIIAVAYDILGLYTKEGKEVWKKKSTNEYGVPVISSKGHYVGVEEGDGVSLYDRSGKLIMFDDHNGGGLGFSPDERYFVVVSGNIITMYRTVDGKELWEYDYEKEGGYIVPAYFDTSDLFIENGHYLIFISSHKKTGFYIFDSEKGKVGFIDFGVGELKSGDSIDDYFYYSHKKLYFIVKGQLKVYELSDIIQEEEGK